MARKYTSISIETTISSTISSSATSITVANAGNLLGDVTLGASDQFAVAIDPDTVNEEIVWVTAANTSTNVLTVTRARAGTSGISHAAGATIKHVLTGEDLTYFETDKVGSTATVTLTNKTIALGSNTVSGTTAQFNTALTDGDFATLAGTETLTNKTLTSPTINDGKLNLTLNAQTGTTYTFVLADNGKLVTASNAATQTYSIPTNASVAFPIGTQINIVQLGAGQVTIDAVTPGTTTISSTGATATAPKLRAQYSAATCIKTGTDTWVVTGDIA